MTPLALARRLVDRLRGTPPRPGGLRGVGHDWEREAERALVAARYRILERNFRTKRGEIDLIAEEGGVLCFVEVKGRLTRTFGSPAESVTLEKQRRILRAAEAYLAKVRGGNRRCRFDVVSVDAREEDPARRVTILRNAFESPPAPRRA
jgi:putative endonuclease